MPAAPLRVRAAPLKPVTFTLDWLYQGASVGFLLAKDKGYCRDAGLDVAVSPGKGSATTAQLVASKATQIGFSDGYVVGNSIAKGMAIKTVGSIYRRDPAALMVLADSPIKTPKDLEGKTVAMTAGSAQFQQWPAFAKGAGIDPSKDPDRQYRSGRCRAGAGQRQGRRDRRLRVQLRAQHPNTRQETAAHLLVRRLRRDRRFERRHRASGSAQERPRTSFARSFRRPSRASCTGGSMSMKRSPP